ncbi:MAG: Hsp20/alpha crystallin family protein [Oscillospiraceae bacterium]|nr:Hsp20/alpha crystallin family protein [Oscillospiraceae bacterium]
MFGLIPYRREEKEMSYNPFREMEELEKAFFEEPFAGFFHSEDIAEFKTDISDKGDSYLLEADLPGFKREDIGIDLDGDVLTINAERHSEHEEKDKKGSYLRCERSYGKYSRSFDVSAIQTDQIKAKLDEGVLKLTLPKKQEKKSETKRLEIE